jgi:hypothetical protein
VRQLFLSTYDALNQFFRKIRENSPHMFEDSIPSPFQDAAFPVIPGVTDQFYTRLETLRGRVQ